MKRTIVILIAAFAFACNNAADKSAAATSSADTPAAAETATTADTGVPPGLTQEEFDKAISLIAGSDCLTCHKVEEKHTGPSYKEVSQKYEATDANITLLSDKIIKGGVGVWGQVPMTPHDTLSVENAKAMVKYILALKNVK
jgi:cytochrome c